MSVRKIYWTTSKGEARSAWTVDYVDQRSKRRTKNFAQKKAADAFEAQARIEVRAGTHTSDADSVTVADAAADWLQEAAEAGLERSTRAQYRQHVDLHIVPFIGALKLSRLTAPMVREFESTLRAEGRSPAMVGKVLRSLSSILSDAMERGRVNRNVVRELRSRRKPGKEARAEGRRKGKLKVGEDIPTREEIGVIIKHLQGRWRPLILTAIFTGLRASELRGLSWANIDLDAAKLHVRERADRYNEIGRPKSEAGERTVPLTPMLVNTLKALKLETGGQGLAFGTGTGRPEGLANIRNRGLIPAQIAAGIVDAEGNAKYPGMHALRHFYASWCINPKAAGGLELPAKVVQERLGHSSIVMTMDVYGHLFPAADDSAELAAAEAALFS